MFQYNPCLTQDTILAYFLNFLKKENAYAKWKYCINNYKSTEYTLKKWLRQIKLGNYKSLVTWAPFTWNTHTKTPNSDLFWGDMDRKWQICIKK